MTPEELKNRTMQLGIDIIFLCEKLPAKAAGRAIENQIVRSATSVGCNYRAALRGRSKPDFINKIGVVLEELGAGRDSILDRSSRKSQSIAKERCSIDLERSRRTNENTNQNVNNVQRKPEKEEAITQFNLC